MDDNRLTDWGGTEPVYKPCKLNLRELDIIHHLSYGASHKEVAERMKLTLQEVNRSVARIKYHTKKTRDVAIVAMAIREKWIE